MPAQQQARKPAVRGGFEPCAAREEGLCIGRVGWRILRLLPLMTVKKRSFGWQE